MPPTQLNIQRITQLEEQLDTLYAKRAFFENELVITASPNEKFELQRRLKTEIRPILRSKEQEYAQRLAGAVEPIRLPESEAQAVVEDMRVALASHERAASGEQFEELRSLLIDLRAKLDEPGKAAAAKLKVALPLIPLLAKYELELDTESFVTQVWRHIRGLLRRAVPNRPS